MKHAFTLVELSIVLVILGLLVGGVLAGQNLIRAAELRSVTTEFTNYQTAVMTFKEKYFALPGDMDNAGAFWGYADTSGTGGVCGAPATDTGTGTQTCDGDGDTEISGYEQLRFWQHLANAGLLEGSFTGVDPDGGSDSDTNDAALGENVPESRLGGGGWGVASPGAYSGSTLYFDGNYGNFLSFGSHTDGNAWPNNEVIRPEEAWAIDTKMDDGLPAQGRVVARHNSVNCVDAADGSDDPDADDLDAVYELSETTRECNLTFRQVF